MTIGIVWMWAWKVLVSWWSGVAPSSTWVSSYKNSNSSLSLHSVGWLPCWWRDCSGWWLYRCRSRRGLFWIHLNSFARLLGWHNSTSLPFWSQIFISQILFPYFYSVTKFACWIFSLHLLKERKGERKRKRKRKRFPLLTMLVALLVPSWRLIPIFRHGNMMWWILMEHIVPCLWIGQSTHQTFLGPIQYVLTFLFLCLHFFLAYWMAHDMVNLCFRLMWILWRKACEWLEACNRWLVLSPPNMCSMRRAGYAMMLSECLWLRLFLLMKLTLDFPDFLGTSNGSC